MTVCTVFILIALALVVLGGAALCLSHHERHASFSETVAFRDDERYAERELR